MADDGDDDDDEYVLSFGGHVVVKFARFIFHQQIKICLSALSAFESLCAALATHLASLVGKRQTQSTR